LTPGRKIDEVAFLSGSLRLKLLMMKRFFLKKACLIIFVFLFFLNSCSLIEEYRSGSSKALNIGVWQSDFKLLQELKIKFGSNKINIIKNIDEKKALSLLHNNQIDAYLGTLRDYSIYQNEINEKLFARDAIAIVVHPSNPLNNLSKEQLREIFSRKIISWKNLIDLDKPLIVIDRTEDDISKLALYEMLFASNQSSFVVTMVASKDSDIKNAIGKFPNSISFMSFRNLEPALKALSIDNIKPNISNIETGYYPLTRPISIYTSKSSSSKLIYEFLDFLYGQKTQTLISHLLYMPLTEAELQLLKTNTSPILIGVAAPMDDLYTDLGKSIVGSANIAKDEINARGGINGRKIEIITCNDKAKISTALECANKFVKANVSGVIGHLTSQTSIEASKIYARYGIVQISPASTHPLFTERPEVNGFVYRTIGRDDQQARLMANLIRSLPGQHPKKVSIFGNNTLYSSTLVTMVESEIQKINLDKVSEIKTIKQGQSQHQNEIKNLSSQVLVFVGEYGEGAQILKELALANKKDVVFIGADGVFSKRFIQDAGLRAEDAYVTGNTINEKAPAVIAFVEKFQSQFKSEPSAFAMNSYDAMMVLVEAISAYENKKFPSIQDAMQATEYEGLTGVIKFNEMGDLLSSGMSVYQVKDGRFEKIP
jgi:branched-chain amino acid transport system substrate-binding protein